MNMKFIKVIIIAMQKNGHNIKILEAKYVICVGMVSTIHLMGDQSSFLPCRLQFFGISRVSCGKNYNLLHLFTDIDTSFGCTDLAYFVYLSKGI